MVMVERMKYEADSSKALKKVAGLVGKSGELASLGRNSLKSDR
jgi:hypothetical protein